VWNVYIINNEGGSMMVEQKGVLVCAEVTDQGRISPITLELLGIGRKLADDLGSKLSAVIMGSEIGNIAEELIFFGADNVYLVDNPLLKEYQTDPYVTALQRLSKYVTPDIIVIGQTSIGQDLAPRLAFRLKTRLTTDCINLDIDPETKLLFQTKPVYGGNVLAVYACETKPQMATVRARAMSPSGRDDSRRGKVIPFDSKIDASLLKTEVVKRVKEEAKGVKLEDADIVVSGGRGIGGPDGFKQIDDLAKLLGGAVGASRPPCDMGWVSSTCQVGLTGKIVAPNLYIAISISGTSQHFAGMLGSKNIVAINKDPEANIFKVADIGIIGDYRKVLPAFIENLRKIAAHGSE